MKKRVLIIEDDHDLLELLRIVFRDSGYEVVFSPNLLDTDYINVLHPDLILLDVRIAGSSKSGVDLCKELKTHPDFEKLPIILCSGEHNLPELARKSHADMYLTKPYDLAVLLSHVNKYLL
ncbi:response regulator [Dyadobacter sp. MSC1_007]|uniref:response regulator n=1 Tax=Dyadobacter sp. MSC1_007 TaxID=2909264 RepID=UPI0038D4E805